MCYYAGSGKVAYINVRALCMHKQRKLLSCRSFKMSNYRKGSDASSGFFSESPASQSLPPPLAHSNSKGFRKCCQLRLWCRRILFVYVKQNSKERSSVVAFRARYDKLV